MPVNSLKEISDSESEEEEETIGNIAAPICTFRRAQTKDIEEVKTLISPNINNYFGNKSINHLIYRCFYSMVAINSHNRIVAIICLDDHPNIPALPISEWETWITKLYDLPDMTSQNSLWIHLLACNIIYSYTFVKPMLKRIFETFPRVLHLLVSSPPEVPILNFVEENFTCVMPVGYSNPRKVQTLYLTVRYNYVKKYKIRLAVEEDNDDIVSLVDTHSPILKEMYGEYYVSEILTQHPDMNRKLIVGEFDGRVVAVLFLNADVNYKSLIKSFALEPFCNLHKITELNYHEDITPSKMKTVNPSSCSIDSFKFTDLMGPPPVPEIEDVKLEEVFSRVFKPYSEQEIDLEEIGVHESELIETMLLSDTNMLNYSLEELEEDEHEISIISSLDKDLIESTTVLYQKASYNKLKLGTEVEENAFTLEVMVAEKEYETSILCDLFEACFQSFPNIDYCVMTTPPNQSHFPLFDHFVKVIPRRNGLFPQELYVLHKNAIKTKLIVRKMKKSDLDAITKLLHSIAFADIVTEELEDMFALKQKELKAFVLVDNTVIIGFTLMKTFINIDDLLAYYNVHTFVNYQYHKYDRFGSIEYFIYSPPYSKHAQFFIRELHRLTDMSILFYKLHKEDTHILTRTRPLPTILADFIPVPIRQLPVLHTMRLEEVEVPRFFKPDVIATHEYFSLYISTPTLCSLPRMEINSRLVIVGVSATGLSFLENLIFQFDNDQHVLFNNLTLIYNQGVKCSTTLSRFTPMMFVNHGYFDRKHMIAMALRSHVNYVDGFMTTIDRKNKYITLNNNTIVPYDYLFLTCGQQYQLPYSMTWKNGKYDGRYPSNVFMINKRRDSEKAFKRLKRIINNRTEFNIIIYGATLNAYCCLATLLRMNIPKPCIKFVEPFPDPNERPAISTFIIPEVYEAVQNIIDWLQIQTYRSYFFVAWDQIKLENTTIAITAKFQSQFATTSLNCDAMFYYGNKDVNFTTFSALNGAGLVYDGKLVIQSDCLTNDPSIFAAGPMTKYSRKYFADRYLHKYYSSYEIGLRLAKHVRTMLLPGGPDANIDDEIYVKLRNKQYDKMVPQYNWPIVNHCVLPGGYNYLEVRKPGKPLATEIAQLIDSKDKILKTGKLDLVKNGIDPYYFRIHLNSRHNIKHIICLTKKDIDVCNIIRLYGLNEKLLNRMFRCYQTNLIPDFYDYFRRPSFSLLYMDTYSNLRTILGKIMRLLTEQPGNSAIEDIYVKVQENSGRKLYKRQYYDIKEKFLESPYQEMIIQTVMDFIGENYETLPMYAHPYITSVILQGYEDSILFKSRK